MYESKYETNKASRNSVSQIYVLYSCNYDNKMILTFNFDLTSSIYRYVLYLFCGKTTSHLP